MNAAEILAAGGNPGKLRELAQLLEAHSVTLRPQADFAVPAAAETGSTFVENALIKARHAADLTGRAAIADDSGLEVDVLGGAPGVYSARYAGVGAADEDNLRLLLKNIAATGASRPTARFQCALAYVRGAGDPAPLIARGTWEGYIVDPPRGKNGFGYDPVFYVPDHGCTSAELPPRVKNDISHRGQGLRALVAMMEQAGVLA